MTSKTFTFEWIIIQFTQFTSLVTKHAKISKRIQNFTGMKSA